MNKENILRKLAYLKNFCTLFMKKKYQILWKKMREKIPILHHPSFPPAKLTDPSPAKGLYLCPS